MKKIGVVIISAIVLSGCGADGAPSCSDSEVKDLVHSISTDELKNSVFKNFVGQSGTIVAGNYDLWKNNPPSDVQMIKDIIGKVDDHVENLAMKLEGIRINKKDDEIKKSECSVQLVFSNGSQPSVDYTAQYTEEGDVYVEVFGL